MADDGKAEEVSPPFHGFIATTYDALLVFEAARRGIIPRVTRRLNDSERNMVQSGAVFVYDEQESGIKRWTDGHSWSPSRILANFLVYRETVKPADGAAKDSGSDEMMVKRETASSRPASSHGRPATATSSPGNISPGDSDLNLAESSRMASERRTLPTLAHGQMRPRSAAEAAGGGCRLENGIVINRNQERQLVGSLTNSYLFQPGGLVKKTMTLIISGFHQHVVSYYTLEDAVAGRLRRPSMIPEFASLQISPDYLNIANFRYPPSIEVGIDGIPRYHGEPDDRPSSRGGAPPPVWNAPEMHDGYGPPVPLDAHYQPRMRTVMMPNMSSSFPPAPMSDYPLPPGSSGGGGHDLPAMHSMQPAPRQTGPSRPSTTGSRRYDPYASSSRGEAPIPVSGSDSGHIRRQSQPPSISEGGYYQSGDYNYQPPSTAPGAFQYYSAASSAGTPTQPMASSPLISPSYGPSQYGWHGQASGMRILSAPPGRMLGDPPSSSGSDSAPGSSHMMGAGGGDGWTPMTPASAPPPVWDNHHQHAHQSQPPMPQQYTVPQSEGWQAGYA